MEESLENPLLDFYREPNDDINTVKNLDETNVHTFLNSLYRYHDEQGLLPIIFSNIFSFIAVQFSIFLLFVLIFCIDYNAVFILRDLEDSLVHPPPVAIACTVIIMVAYAIFQTIMSGWWIMQAYEVRKFLRDKVKLSDEEVQCMPWTVFVGRVKDHLHYKHKPITSELELMRLMMTLENYIIAMLNDEVLVLKLRAPCGLPFAVDLMATVTEFLLRNTLISFAFTNGIIKHSLQEENCADLERRLKKSFRMKGIIAFLVCPIVLVALLIYAFFNYVAEIRRSPSSLANRSWTPAAKVKFRLLNESRRETVDRLNKAADLADKYIDQFQSPLLVAFSRFAMFIAGALLAVLAVIAVINEDFLEVSIGGRKVLWIIPVLLTAVSLFRVLIPPDDFVYEPGQIMKNLLATLGQTNKEWIANAFTAKELLCIILAPILFIFVLPGQSMAIIKFLKDNTDWTADPPQFKYSHLAMGQREPSDEKIHKRDVEAAVEDFIDPMQHSKLAYSVLAFKAKYPHWKPSDKRTEDFITKTQIDADSTPMMQEFASTICTQKSSDEAEMRRNKWGMTQLMRDMHSL